MLLSALLTIIHDTFYGSMQIFIVAYNECLL